MKMPPRNAFLEREKDVLLLGFEELRAFAQAIVDTVREPFLVLNELRIAASCSFYSAFKVEPIDTQGRLLYALGDGQWDIPGLRLLLEIVPERGVMEDYEVEHVFPDIGQRTMLLNGRKVFYEGGSNTTILLGIEDVTAQRILEREKDVLFEELQHRVSNSLQIIASILLMKARVVQSEEAQFHLFISSYFSVPGSCFPRPRRLIRHEKSLRLKARGCLYAAKVSR